MVEIWQMFMIGASELEKVDSTVDWIQFLRFYNDLSFSSTSLTNDPVIVARYQCFSRVFRSYISGENASI